MSDVITTAAAKLGAKISSFDGVAKFVIPVKARSWSMPMACAWQTSLPMSP